MSACAEDVDAVERLLGRPARADFDVVCRDGDRILVIRNAAFLFDGTPMPTRYWLVDPELARRVARLESDGGVRAAEAAVPAAEIEATHERYARERDATIAADATGPRPFGGVGGTRQGVKCLHAHYAHHLAGGNDPVGAWVAARLAAEAESQNLGIPK